MTAGKLSAASWCYVRTVRLVSGPFRKVECLFQSAQSHSYGSIEMHVLALCGSHWPAPCLAVCHVNIKLANIYIYIYIQWTMTFYLAQAKMSKSCAFDFRTTQQQVPGSTSKMSITSWRTRHLNWNLVERRCMQINLMPLYLFGTQLINSSFDSCFYFSKFLKTATFNSANISCRLHASCFVSWFYFLFVNGPIYMLIKRTIYMLIKRTRLTWNFEILSIYVVCH
jgi:hypothetical protein